jgi:hypothetical protein
MEALRETALLGTDKKALDIQQLPEPVRAMLREAQAPDPEWQFLEANAFYHFYEMTGRLPAKFAGTIDETIVEEEMTVAPKELMDVLGRIELVDHELRERALSLCLDVLINKKWIVSSDRLVELIQGGNSLSSKTKAKIVSVIGRKGLWILENDASLSYAVAPARADLWIEGTMQERKNIFSGLRRSEPESAITLLKSTWTTESIVNKKSFLELIKQTSTSTDIPFLEELSDEFKYHSKEKKTEKECRRLVVSMLVRYDSTTLFKITTENLGRYMVKAKKGIVGLVTGQSSCTFRLPDVEDDFWNSKTMEEVYGFEVKNYDIAIYDNIFQFWLSYFIEYIPFAFWVKAFEADHRKAVQFWLVDKTTTSGMSMPIYLQPMINNALEYGDRDLALALLQSQPVQTLLPLLQLLTPGDYESLALKNNYLDDIQVLMSGPFYSDQSWSLSFSEAVLAQAYKLAEQTHASPALGSVIAQFAHHDSIDTLYQLNNKARDSSAYHNWNTAIFQVVHPMLEIRNKIKALKK